MRTNFLKKGGETMIIFWKHKIYNTKYLKFARRQLTRAEDGEKYLICGKFDDGQEEIIAYGLSKVESERLMLEIADNFSDDEVVHYTEVL